MPLFGNLFDLDHDGHLSDFEKAAELGFLAMIMDAEKNDALVSAGLDQNELEDMGYFERREALERAGLDPDDFE